MFRSRLDERQVILRLFYRMICGSIPVTYCKAELLIRFNPEWLSHQFDERVAYITSKSGSPAEYKEYVVRLKSRSFFPKLATDFKVARLLLLSKGLCKG